MVRVESVKYNIVPRNIVSPQVVCWYRKQQGLPLQPGEADLEVANMRRAAQRINRHLYQGREIVDPDLIILVNQDIVSPADSLLTNFDDLRRAFEAAKRIPDKVEKALAVGRAMVEEEFFNDGNCRTAFLLLNGALAQEGLPSFAIQKNGPTIPEILERGF